MTSKQMVLQTQDASKLTMKGKRNNSLKCKFTIKHLRKNVRATAPELAGDPKFKYITNQLINDTHLAGDPKRKGCGSLLG